MKKLSLMKKLTLALFILVITSSHICKQQQVWNGEYCTHCSSFKQTVTTSFNYQLTSISSGCSCKQGLYWSATRTQCRPIPQGFTTKKYQSLVSTARMLATSCDPSNGYVLLGDVCLSCRLIPYSLGKASDPSSCTCSADFYWWGYASICYCARYTNAGYYLTNGQCLSCTAITDATLRNNCNTTCDSAPLKMASGICFNTTCPTGQIFIESQYGCECDVSSNYASNGVACVVCSSVTGYTSGKCNNNCTGPIFYFNVFQCWLVSSIPNFNGVTGACLTGFIQKKHPLTKQIISCTCNQATSAIINGVCTLCTSFSADATKLTGCKSCLATSMFYQSYAQCIYCPGMSGATGLVTNSGCQCLTGYYWNELTGKCVCDWVFGYITSPDGTCLFCSSLKGASAFANNKGCICLKGYVWNALKQTCDCDVSSGSGALILNGNCINCNDIMGSNGVIYSNGTCGCLLGLLWNPSSKKCDCNYLHHFYVFNSTCRECYSIPFSTGFASSTGCICKQGYIWLSNLGCACPAGYVNQEGKCLPCSQATLPAGATVSDCNICNKNKSFISPSNTQKYCMICLGQIGTTNTPGNNNICQCKANMIWSNVYRQCICANSTGVNADQTLNCFTCKSSIAGSCTCQYLSTVYNGYIFDFSYTVCTHCPSIPNTITGVDISNTCKCKSGYRYRGDSYPFKCVCSFNQGAYMSGTTCKLCSSLTSTTVPTIDGCYTCDSNQGFLLIGFNDTCMQCKSISGSTGKGSVAGCQCISGLTWNITTLKCEVSCNISTSITTSSGTCISCDTILNSNKLPNSSSSCGCLSTFTWDSSTNTCKTNIPTCDLTKNIQVGTLCYPCSSTLYSTSVNNLASCKCQSDKTWSWSQQLNKGYCNCSDSLKIIVTGSNLCVCDNTIAIVNGQSCLLCSTDFLSTGRTNANNRSICQCLPSYSWNNVLKKCECPLPRKVGKEQTCGCDSPLVYNQTINKCVCNASIALSSVNQTCLYCSTILYSTSATFNATACVCLPGFIFRWNATTQTGVCSCPTSNSLSPYFCQRSPDFTRGFITKNGLSVSCRLLVKSSGMINPTNSSACQCLAPWIWQPQVSECLCYKFNTQAYFYNGSQCVSCNSISNINTKNSCQRCSSPFGWGKFGCLFCPFYPRTIGASDGYCICQTGYVWNYHTMSCQCDYNNDYVLQNGQCIKCQTLYPNTSTPQFRLCYSCLGIFFLRQYQCVYGSTIPNYKFSSKTSFQEMGRCQVGYQNKVNPLTRFNFTCTCSVNFVYYLNGTTCQSCLLINTLGITQNDCISCRAFSGFYRSPSQCIFCPGVVGSTGRSLFDGCECRFGYFWNATSSSCECDWASGYIGITQCLNCSALLVKYPFLYNTCNCVAGLVFLNGNCTCPGVNRVAMIVNSSLTCQCKAPLVQNGNGVCVPCPSNQLYDNGKCSSNACSSPKIIVQNICVDCGSLALALPNNGVNCNCTSPMIWNSTGRRCSCGVNSIINNRSICFACPARSSVATPLNCKCDVDGQIWSERTRNCILCSSITNSLSRSVNGVYCICANGFYFDVYTLSCVRFCNDQICNTAFTCPNGSLSVSGLSPFILPEDDKFILQYANSLLGVNNYEFIGSQRCGCQSGYSWSSVRFNCFMNKLGK